MYEHGLENIKDSLDLLFVFMRQIFVIIFTCQQMGSNDNL